MIPPKEDAAFVCAMEDILAVYTRKPDERNPVVCIDESNCQLVGHLIKPLAMKPGKPLREDCDFSPGPKVNFFMVYAPLLGWRRVKVTERRCAVDFADVVKEIVDVDFPNAERITLVMDNLNTHSGASLYKRFEPSEARRLLERLDIHYTPKHGSWLNMAEIEFSVLSRQCLARRISTMEEMRMEVRTWWQGRNQVSSAVDWQFSPPDARIKLKKLYPTILNC